MQTTPMLGHRTVLLQEAVEALALRENSIVVDATYGRGGHTREILRRLGPAGRVYALDRDPVAHADGAELARRDTRFHIARAPFSSLAAQLRAWGVERIDGLLMDLGVSSPQLDDPTRGFSFRLDGPLDMRMDANEGGQTAAEWLASASEHEIAEVVREYGEERFAVPIAKAIVTRIEQAGRGEAEPLETTRSLAGLVAAVVRSRQGRSQPGHDPATRTFQAIRIFINRELDEIGPALAAGVDALNLGGRVAVITFHSLEDRIVKTLMRGDTATSGGGREGRLLRRLPALGPAPLAWPLRALGKSKPAAEEIEQNPRARSAMLRVAERSVSDLDGRALLSRMAARHFPGRRGGGS